MTATKRTNHSSTNNHTVVGDTLRTAGHKVDEYSKMAADKSDEWIQDGQETIEHFQQEVERYSDGAIQYIKKYPLKSALLAGAVGLILGKLFSK